jgi:hypothetical protein
MAGISAIKPILNPLQDLGFDSRHAKQCFLLVALTRWSWWRAVMYCELFFAGLFGR